MTRLLLWSAFLLSTSHANGDGDGDDVVAAACTLTCPVDAPCTLGDALFSHSNNAVIELETTNAQGMHCACPPGWTGILCDHKFETCSDSHDCFHGGKCRTEDAAGDGRLEDAFGNPQLLCDCTHAQTTTAEGAVRYVGKYCETPFEKSCAQDDDSLFCVNGGDCNPNVDNDGIPCLCSDGWEGIHCEFKEGETPVCDLDCANQGTCVVGIRSSAEVDLLRRIWSDEEISSHMQCLCRPAAAAGFLFGGPLCESPLEVCGSGGDSDSGGDSADKDDVCYHGGTCVTTTTTTTTTTEQHRCDCTTATDSQGNRFAGDYCQEVSTVFCGDSKNNGDNNNKNSTSSLIFCTNGGSCHASGDPVAPCHCPEGFSGHKCEYDTRPSSNNDDDDDDDDDEQQDQQTTTSEPCGDIFCLNGSTCTSRDFSLEDGTQGSETFCECTTAHKPSLYQAFAGEACQYKSTAICSSSTTQEQDNNVLREDLQFCVNGGTCLDEQQDDDGSYCACPTSTGFTGLHCEVHSTKKNNDPTNANAQDDDAPTCGDSTVCYNGGKCVETIVSEEDTNGDGTVGEPTTYIEHYCDCQTAVDDDHVYSGTSCEYQSTSLCTDKEEGEGLEGFSFFCANHGSCYSNIQQGCNCLDGFEGFHCEFLALDKDPNEDKKESEATAPQDDEDGSGSSSTQQCGELVCKNGGTCATSIVKKEEDDQDSQSAAFQHVQHCDCSTTATETTIFAGSECEHEATEFCTEPEDGNGLDSTTIYCVQGGTCNSQNVFRGCDCSPGWTGMRCEFAVDLDDLLQEPDSDGQTECGDKICYHGGVCDVSQQVNTDSGALEDVTFCDCSTTATASEIYGGPTCSYKSTSVCQTPENNDEDTLLLSRALVCFNHGTCRDDPLQGCDCPSGFTGSLCQFEVEEDEHADQGVTCGDGFCYHGGQCVTTKIVGEDDETTVLYHCDCDLAFDDTNLFAGDSCQYKSTSQCTHPQDGEDSLQGSLFCVNGGTCDEDFEQGCQCPKGWTGFFCEYEERIEDVLGDDESDQDLERCGDNVCLNGGTCVSTVVTTNDGTKTTLQYCDCNTAYDEDSIFAGPNCEYTNTALCTQPADGAPNLAGVDFCVNGGKCNQDNLFGGCLCDETHWTGMRCELKLDDFDDDKSQACGNIACLNGGQCSVSVDNDVESFSCDCSSAFDDLHLYDGPYCQYQSTELCSKPEGGTLAKVDFCVNEGQCQDDGACRCPAGYYGPRCEMTIYEDQGDSEDVSFDQEDNNDLEYVCRLTCSNGGACVKGVKDLGSYEDAIGSVDHLNKTYHETYFEHCACPDGFVGLTCEHKVEMCGDNEQYCLHGSTCIEDTGGSICDCSKADETIGHGDQPSLFAGESCQHPANDICVQGAAFPTRPLSFCVNGGTCRDYVSPGEEDPGCDCESGWTGPHCETRNYLSSESSESIEGGVDVLLISLVTALLVVVLLVLITCLLRLGKSSTNNDSSQDWMIFRRRRQRHQLSEDPGSRSSNLAPKRCSSNIDSFPAVVSPSSSPNSVGIALPPDEEPVPYRDDPVDGFRDEPDDELNVVQEDYSDEEIIVDVGPPRDEDGHQLHNVDFL